MTTVRDVAPLVGPRALQMLKALNACAAGVDRYGNNPGDAQNQYARASLLLEASAFHGACAAKVFPEWAQRIGTDVDNWRASLHAVGQTWGDPILNLPPPTATLAANPYGFANRLVQVTNDAVALWGGGPVQAWNPDTANADPPPEWIQDTYNGLLDFCQAIPIIGWLVEALMWLVGGIASLFVDYADDVFAISRPEITQPMLQAAIDQIAAVRVSFESVLEQAKGAGWQPSTGRTILAASAPAAAGTSAGAASTRTRQIVAISLGTAAALALVWVALA